jgi:hypothetical protein
VWKRKRTGEHQGDSACEKKVCRAKPKEKEKRKEKEVN